MIGIVDGDWHAATLPVATVFVFCTGTLFVTRRVNCWSCRFSDCLNLRHRDKNCRNVLNSGGLFDGSL